MTPNVIFNASKFLNGTRTCLINQLKRSYFHKSTQTILNVKCSNYNQNKLISFFRAFKKPDAIKFKIKDNIPEQYDLIYRNGMDNYLLVAHIFTTTTAALVCISTLIESGSETMKFEKWATKPKTTDSDMIIMVSAFIFFWVALQAIVAKMPIRIYNYPKLNKYILIFHGNIPLLKSTIHCNVSDFSKVRPRGILPWKDFTYEIENNRNVILIENYFRRPADLNIILGYQKYDSQE